MVQTKFSNSLISVRNHRWRPGDTVSERSEPSTQDARTEQRRDSPDEAEVGPDHTDIIKY